MSDGKQFGLFLNRKSGTTSDSGDGTKKPKNVKQRWLIIAGALAVFAVIASSFFADAPKPILVDKKAAAAALVDTTPKGAEQQTWERKSQEDIATLKASVSKIATENQTLKAELADEKVKAGLKQNTPTFGGVPPPTLHGQGEVNLSALPSVIPPPPVPISRTADGLPKSSNSPDMEFPVPAPAKSEPLSFKPEAHSASATPSAGTVAQLDVIKTKTTYQKNPNYGLLPAGAFAPIALLNGLDAGTSAANQSNPQPVLMQIQDQAVLPGAASYKLKSCFALGSAYGDLSAERVYVRLARISCVDKSSHLILTSAVQGYVVDSDGKLGLRGIVVDRQGARLGKALLAGFAQGLSGALGQAQGTTTTGALGTGTSITGASALNASGLSGASSAAQQLAQFYLKEAQAIFPVITVDIGRTGTLVFSDSVSLKWGDGDPAYTKEVTPQ